MGSKESFLFCIIAIFLITERDCKLMNDNHKPLNVVAVFAHPDDESGAVGTLMNHSDRGDNVYVVMLTHVNDRQNGLCKICRIF